MAGNSWIDVYWEMSVDPNYLGESAEDTNYPFPRDSNKPEYDAFGNQHTLDRIGEENK